LLTAPARWGRGIINRSAWLRLACQRAPLTCYVTVTLLTLVRLVEGRRTAVESNSNRSCKHSREYDDDGYVGVYIIAHEFCVTLSAAVRTQVGTRVPPWKLRLRVCRRLLHAGRDRPRRQQTLRRSRRRTAVQPHDDRTDQRGMSISWTLRSCVEQLLLCVPVSRRKKAPRGDANTALAVIRRSQKFSPRRRPLPASAGRTKFNQLEMVTTFTYRPSLVRGSMHAISSYRANRPPPNTHRQDRLQYTAPQLASAQCN